MVIDEQVIFKKIETLTLALLGYHRAGDDVGIRISADSILTLCNVVKPVSPTAVVNEFAKPSDTSTLRDDTNLDFSKSFKEQHN